MKKNIKRVVVTGLGLVSPLGCDLPSFWDNIINGRSGIAPIKCFDVTEYPTRFAGEVVGFNVDNFISKKDQRHMDPFCHYGVAAAKLATTDAGLNLASIDPFRVGVVVGSGIGGLQTMRSQVEVLLTKGPNRFSPFMIPQMITNILAGFIAIDQGLKGPNFCVTSACATATHSIGEAMRVIQYGDADIMLAGGAEAPVCEMGVGGFCALRALSTRNDDPEHASRPFDATRDGFILAEGAGIIVIEELEHAKKRGAKIYCELAGYGRTCDAYHMTAPDEGATSAAKGMSLAINDAGLQPGDVDYINAHGTSTKLNDRCETKAIKIALGEEHAHKVMISSTKSMTGHLLGAAGAVESIICALAIANSIVPPTTNYENPDPECDLDYVPNVARKAQIKTCLNNSLGFGGHNATLCFKAY